MGMIEVVQEADTVAKVTISLHVYNRDCVCVCVCVCVDSTTTWRQFFSF